MMMLTYNPFAELNKIQRQFDQAFETMTEAKTRWTPAIELQETAESYILKAILPNLETETLNIEASRKAIAISGQTNRPELAEGEKYLHSEFPVGEFRRVIALPEAIAHTEVKAHYEDGILTVTLPKAPETVNRVVKVNLSVPQEAESIEAN